MNKNPLNTTAIDALRDELTSKIDWQTDRLSANLDLICTCLGIIAVTLFGGFLCLSAVLYAALNR